MNGPKMYTSKEVAAYFGVNLSKVIGWIGSGELRAINVSQKRGGQRGRWRIEWEAIAAFKATRENTTVREKTPRRRRVVVNAVVDEF